MAKFRTCTSEEFKAFVANYPNPLVRDVCGIGEPPLLSFNDFRLGPWPQSVVASVILHEDCPLPGLPTTPNTYQVLEDDDAPPTP